MISIIIPARNEEKNIGDMLQSIKDNHYRNKYEVVVVDGMSEDRTVEIAKKFGARVVPQGGKLGVGDARNVGWKNAKGDIIVFVEADHMIGKGFLKEIEKVFADKKVVAARYNPVVVAKSFFQKIFAVQVRISEIRQKSAEFPTIFRKSVLVKSGGYDSKLSFGEDREFPHRLKKMGIKSATVGKAILYVKVVDSFKRLWKQGMWYGKNMIPYAKKTGDYLVVVGTLINSLALPFLILGILNNIFLYLSGILFLLIFLRTIQGFLYTKSVYSIFLPLIWITRSTASLIGILESPFLKHMGV
jgi:cellulose synthase/poly-beta-1,6-N-acetylglucosamine synthase-like glycosyltransferase